jgi:signal transduction histidine kinase
MLTDPERYTADELQDFGNRIVRQCDALAARVDKVLNFSRVSAGHTTYDLQPHDLAGAAERVLEAQTARFRHLGFDIDLVIDSRPVVRLDSEGFSDAILKLLENAVKYSGESRRIETQIYCIGGEAVLAVRDFGIGIPPAETKRIFQRFYRFPAAGKAGFGIGLWLVRQIMNRHNGRVEVSSEPGHGSEFRLVFPLLCDGC